MTARRREQAQSTGEPNQEHEPEERSHRDRDPERVQGLRDIVGEVTDRRHDADPGPLA